MRRPRNWLMVPFFGDAPNPRSEEYLKYLRQVRNLGVGGLVLVNRVAGRPRTLHRAYPWRRFSIACRKSPRSPCWSPAISRRGDSMRLESKTLFPHAMAFAATRDPSLSRFEASDRAAGKSRWACPGSWRRSPT